MNSTLISTLYPKSIKHSSEASVLKPGRNNKKLGWKITKGKWKGKYLYSLTLTERATCPTSCHHWDDCYGNNMPFAHRFDTRGLIQKLEQEIPQLLSKHKKGIVIRLHVLGDFYSVDYARFWQKMLVQYDDLCIFGYTARELDSKIGRAIWLNNIRFSDRHVIRWSRNYTSDELGKWFAIQLNKSFLNNRLVFTMASFNIHHRCQRNTTGNPFTCRLSQISYGRQVGCFTGAKQCRGTVTEAVAVVRIEV